MPALLWFRRDLRVRDHPALLAAADSDQVLACFVLDPRLERSSGQRRLQFLGDALRALRDDLDGRLLVVRGRPEHQIPLLAREIGAPAVHISEDFAPYGKRRDEKVSAALGSVPLVATGSPYLVSPGRVTKPDGDPYKVFTPFLRQWRAAGWRTPAKSDAASARWIDPADVPIQACAIPDPGSRLDIAAGTAHEQWKSFVGKGLKTYDTDRNRPGIAGTSRMSAHLKFGTIHPRSMVVDLDPRERGAQAYLRELAFRDFYADVLHHWPRSAWRNWNSNFDDIETDTGAEAQRRFEAWQAGQTGFPIVDAGMRQLRQIGFMPNRVRMIVASFLVKDLHLPWQWGAAWFLDQLVDGDMANNQHGWQWCAGSGTDAAPYFRVFNPTTQGVKFDPDGDYIRQWVPELRHAVDAHVRTGDRPPGYPAPIVDHGAERREALHRYQVLSS
ncbi:deoxyribodipyrimidine photo-lyase [Mycobacterium sherrisii]|uniref:cryptochrome/photolyase family protein n=1 Tax=Mycobacterium sherrisii TaxID=243061 RepID=UPI002DDC9EAA|nr:deoxyribodipyrimidine photo-lyase [Mycobacterium sherrisii]MEC4763238.1 deoxyribodipyrimidine photo-lyase [Mycobacterium sherrisii]